MATPRQELTEEQWQRIKALLRWSKRGVWKAVLDALAVDRDDELAMFGARYGKAVPPIFSRFAPCALRLLDASIVRAHQDAAGGRKNGSESIGRSRGGPSTKIHAVVDALGNTTKISLTEGQVHDATQAAEMLREAVSTFVLADKGYSASRSEASPVLVPVAVPVPIHLALNQARSCLHAPHLPAASARGPRPAGGSQKAPEAGGRDVDSTRSVRRAAQRTEIGTGTRTGTGTGTQ